MAQQNGPITTSQMVVDDGAIIQVIEQLKIMRDIYVKALDDIIGRAKVLDSSLVKMEGTLEQQQKKVQQVAVEAENLAHKDAEVRAEIESLTAKIAKLEAELEKLRKAKQQSTKTTDAKAKAEERLKFALSEEGKEVELIRQKTNQATTANRNAAKQALATANSVEAQRLKVAALKREWATMDRGTPAFLQKTKELRSANKELMNLEKSVGIYSRGVGGYFKSMAVGIQNFALQAVGFMAVVKMIGSGVRTIVEFQQANANLATILGTTQKNITELTASAKYLGETTEYTASQVTALQTELAKLGFTEQQIMQMQAPVLQFATALDADLPRASSLAGAALRTFQLDAKDTSRVLSVMAVGANKSALDFSYLETSMAIVSPVANAFNFTIEDTVALLGTLANSGFDASMAATATRNILLNLANSSGKLAKQLGKPVKSLDDLINGLIDLDKRGVDLNASLELTDKRSVAAFNTFLRGAESLRELRGELNGVDGELERIQKERLNTVEGQTKLLKSAWEGLMLSFSGSTGVMKSVLESATSLINVLSQLVQGSKTATQQFKEQAESFVDTEVRVRELMPRYEELIGKTERTETEQSELDSIMKELQRTIPGVVAEFDEYGNILSLNTGRVWEFIDAKRAELKYINRAAIVEETENLKRYRQEYERIQGILQKGTKRDEVIPAQSHSAAPAGTALSGLLISAIVSERELLPEERQKYEDELKELGSTIKGVEQYINELTGESIEERVKQRQEDNAQLAVFREMNKAELGAWIADENNAKNALLKNAQEIYDARFKTFTVNPGNDKADKARQKAAEKAKRQQEQDASARLQLEKKAIENENAAMEKGYNQQVTATINAAKIREQEIQRSYDRIETKTDEDHKTYAKAMQDNNARLFKELNELQANHEIQQLEWTKKGLEMQLATAKKGSDEYLDIQLKQLQIEEQIALRRNALLPKDQQQNPDLISAGFKEQANRVNSSEQLERFDQQAALKMTQWEIDNTRATEEEKFRIRKQAEIDRWKEILRLNDLYGSKMAPEEIKRIKLLIQQGEYEVERSAKKKRPYNNFLDVIGLKFNGETQEEIRERQEAVMQAVNYTVDQLSSVFAAQEQLAQQAINQSQERIDAARSVLDAEREAAANGYANNVAQAQRELALQKQTQEKLLRQQAQMQRAQQAIEALSQTSSLITASANIWASFTGGTGLAGPFLAAAAIAAMWGSFAAAQIKAAQVTRQSASAGAVTYGTGGYEYITGGSHQSGRDVSLGRTQDGRERRIEGGEFLGVINKRATRKYGSELGAIIDSINHGEFERIYMRSAFSFEKAGITINQNADTARLAADVAAIRRQGERQIVSDGKGRIFIFKGNNTKIIKS